MSMSDFPSAPKAESLKRNSIIKSNFQKENMNLTTQKLRESMALIRVFFQNFEYTYTTEAPVYLPLDMISNIGK